MSEEDAAETCRGRVGRAGLATPPGPAGRMIVVPAERSEGAGSFPTWGRRNKVRNIFPVYHPSLCSHLVQGGRDDALDGELPGGEAVLEVGQRLLEEGDEAGLRRGVQLPLQPRGEHLGLHPPVYQTLHTSVVLLVVGLFT